MARQFQLPMALAKKLSEIKNRTMVDPCAKAYSDFVAACEAAQIPPEFIMSSFAHYLATDLVRVVCTMKGAPPSILNQYAHRLSQISLDVQAIVEDRLNAFHADVMADVENRNKREGEKN